LRRHDFKINLRTYRLFRERSDIIIGRRTFNCFAVNQYSCRFQGDFAVRVPADLSDVNFFFLSDVWLDHADTMSGLQSMLDHCIETNFIPKLLVLCGNFTSQSIAQGNGKEVQKYQGWSSGHSLRYHRDNVSTERFEALADLLASYPLITRNTHIVLIPGPLDITVNSTLPQKPILSTLTSKLRAKVPRLHLGSNPCRIKFFHQEIVVFRQDSMSKMLRNVVGVKPNVKGDDLKQFVSLFLPL
jgi:DNA polymerase epsilon subunit 2